MPELSHLLVLNNRTHQLILQHLASLIFNSSALLTLGDSFEVSELFIISYLFMQLFLSNASQIQSVLQEVDIFVADLAPPTIDGLFEYAILYSFDELHKS